MSDPVRSSHRSAWVLAAAVIVVIGALAAALLVTAVTAVDRVDVGPASDSTTALVGRQGEVPSDLLVRGFTYPGTPLRAATSRGQLELLWAGLDLPPDELPSIDFDDQVVVAAAQPADRCPAHEVRAQRTGTEVELRSVGGRGNCVRPVGGRTVPLYVVALDRTALPEAFTLHGRADTGSGFEDEVLPVPVEEPRTTPRARIGSRLRVDGSELPDGMRFLGESPSTSGDPGPSVPSYGSTETVEARFARGLGPWDGDGPYLRIVLRVGDDVGLAAPSSPSDADVVNVEGVGGALAVDATTDPAVALPVAGSDPSSSWLSLTWPVGNDVLVTVQAYGIDRDDLIAIAQTVAVAR